MATSAPTPLGPADIPACLAFSAEAGWNQTAADWALMLSAGRGVGIVTDRLIATAAIVPYEGFGWISMVFVAQSERRRGHARTLMEWAVAAHREAGRVPALDATPAGREVYRRMGFTRVCDATRYEGIGGREDGVSPSYIVPATGDDLAAIIAYDAQYFGVERGTILAALLARSTTFAAVARENGRITGYVIGRNGTRATQIGPLVADREADAAALLSTALSRIDGPVFVDVMDRHEAVGESLTRRGFAVQRRFERMAYGDTEGRVRDAPEIVAIAGPELG
ncbi:GNAT family N-acetyltransferase [Acuticoccus sp. M5D2P5]|uniref:GNAT family N-acetyltransferase n=1 Tax=Acuticoccus kalidii TaxID=2910977 RepID=UPI001F2550E6|nr:GNAT family N-acetyltransferase [Acuticoccus kalidii]MCF3932693.1 GNAT family N-acetyltransferase [Acuticoccus kalidii]